MRQRAIAERLRGLDVLELFAARGSSICTMRAMPSQPVSPDDEDDVFTLLPDDRRDRDRQDDVRDGEADVGGAHDQRVADATEEARRSRPGTAPIIEGHHGGDDADLQRDAGAVDHPAEHVEADACRCRTSAPLDGPWRNASSRGRSPGRRARCSGAKIADEHEEDDEDQPDHGQLVAQKRLPDVLAKGAGGAQVGDVHACRLRDVEDLRLGLGARSLVSIVVTRQPPFPRRMRGSNHA